jgi:hypothetical protein
MASTVYRLSLIAGVNTYFPQAENSRKALSQATPGNDRRWVSPSLPKPSGSTLSKPTGSNAATNSSTTVTSPPSSLSVLPLPGTEPGGTGGQNITLTFVNGTLVPPAATPQPSYCPISISNSSAAANPPVPATHANTTSPTPSLKAKRGTEAVILWQSSTSPPISTLSLNSTPTIAVPSSPISCIMPPVVTKTLSAPTPTTTLPPDSFGSLLHFTNQGWLTPVVSPQDYGIQGSDSPEAQAFVVLMQAAYRDWEAKNASQPATNAKSVAIRTGCVGWVWYVISAGTISYWLL